jgi:hypothetical protein
VKLFEIKKLTPQWLLAEAAGAKGINPHIEHLEDLIFNSGYVGAHAALDYVESLRAMLAEGTGVTTQLTVKWDGAPAVICGIDPSDSKFFVGTKSVFAKGEPKRCKNAADIEKWYSAQPELADKLTAALQYLPKLGIGGVIQGDLMFTPGDVITVSINDEDCYVFTPNTITYAVPVNSALGQRVARAKLGIIFHTAYDGETLETMTPSYGVNVGSLNQTADIWFDDATYKDYTGIASLTPSEDAQIKKQLAATLATMEKIGQDRFDIILTNKEFARNIKPFINQMIRQGEQVGEPMQFLQKFIDHTSAQLMSDIENLSGGIGGRAAQARLTKIKEKEQWVADNANNLLVILATYKRVIELKHTLMRKLQQVESIGTFQKTNDGYKVTTPEGFVAIGHNGGAIKLVDRLEFSRTNFARGS